MVIGERVLSVAPQCVDCFADQDAIQFAAFPHPTEMLTVAADISLRHSLLYLIAQRSIQLAQPIERSISVPKPQNAIQRADTALGLAGQAERSQNISAGGQCR